MRNDTYQSIFSFFFVFFHFASDIYNGYPAIPDIFLIAHACGDACRAQQCYQRMILNEFLLSTTE